MLCCINWCGCNSITNGAERYAGMLLRKNRNVFCCIIDNLSEFFYKLHFFYDNLNHFSVRAPSTSYNQMHLL